MEFVQIEAFETPIGRMRVAATPRGLAYVELPRASGRGLEGWRCRYAADAPVQEGGELCRSPIAQILEYLAGRRRRFELPLDVRATRFEQRVYRELQRIPYGETRSYGDLARALGTPTAARAVGSANGANPIALVIPCHRVIRTGGALGGYGGGLPLKRRLLAMESQTTRQGRLL